MTARVSEEEFKTLIKGYTKRFKDESRLRKSLSKPKIPKALSAGEEALALQLKEAGISFIREFRFHRERLWRFDFVLGMEHGCIAIEIEGGSYSAGRHTRGKGFSEDLVKYNEAALDFWRVLRFTPQMVFDGTAMNCIRRAIK